MDAAIASATTPPAPPPRPVESAQRVEPPAAAAASSSEDRGSSSDGQPNSERSFERDTETGALVYRLVDLNSGIVTIQTPTDARLKLRAYIDGIASSNDQGSALEITA